MTTKTAKTSAPGLRDTLRSRALPTTTVEFIVDDDTTIEVKFRAVPVFVYEALLRDHPAEPGARTAWRAETFVPALLAASTVDAELDVEFWAEYCAGATSKTVSELIDVIFALNGIGAVKR